MVIPSIACAIVSNVAGAEYEGVVFDRFIAVELTDGGQVELFDPGPPIGESLAPGMHARLLLVASILTASILTGLVVVACSDVSIEPEARLPKPLITPMPAAVGLLTP